MVVQNSVDAKGEIFSSQPVSLLSNPHIFEGLQENGSSLVVRMVCRSKGEKVSPLKILHPYHFDQTHIWGLRINGNDTEIEVFMRKTDQASYCL
jgi:hypothetical protein